MAWGAAEVAAQGAPQAEPDRIPPTQTAPASPPSRSTQPLLDDESRARARYTSPEFLEATIDPDSYVLGAGDLISITIQIGETRSEVLPVLPEGVVVPPQIGPVVATGHTLTEFRAALATAVRRRYRDFDLYCYLARPRQFRVWVTGAVRDPGMVAARAVERVSDVVDRAGGLTPQASRREIQLCDADGTVKATVDLAAFLSRGDPSGNPHVSDGQIIRVPARRRTVDINGAVAMPGVYEPRNGESLRDLLELAGGPLPTADIERVTVERTSAIGAVQVSTYALDRDVVPDVGDATRVTVLSRELGRRRAFVIVPDGQRAAYALQDGETVAQLALRAGALDPNADARQARLATGDPDGHKVMIPVDLVAAIAGQGDRVLQDGDVLTIPPVVDYVYVSGYVNRPGRYLYRGDWTVTDYVGEAGGPTAGGSRDGATILDADGKGRSGDRQAVVQRGETVYLERSTTNKAASVLGILANLSALIISVVALNNQ